MTDGAKTNLWAWLVCEGRPPVPLGPTPRVTIGRSKSCDLVLKDASISRLQAEVLVDPDTGIMTFQDGDSSNGSLLNGEEITTAPLKFGDVLSIGSFEVRVQCVVAWLCSGAMAPMPLGANPAVTIGRSKDCDVVIRDRGMSRNQGTIRIKGSSMVYEDGGSSNGSYLNGKRVRGMSPLYAGDVLTFGPYEVHLRSNDEMQSLGQELDEEGTIELTSVTTGLITETPLPQTLQSLSLNLSSGKLTVISGKTKGTMTLVSGQLLRADFGDLRAVEAAMAMLMLEEGRYVFAAGDGHIPPGERLLERTVTSLLLEVSRLRDEQNTPGDEPA